MTNSDYKPLVAACRPALTAKHRHDVERWSALWEELGRADALMWAGDRDGAIAALRRAEDIEHHVTGDCDVVGAVLTAMGVRD